MHNELKNAQNILGILLKTILKFRNNSCNIKEKSGMLPLWGERGHDLTGFCGNPV